MGHAKIHSWNLKNHTFTGRLFFFLVQDLHVIERNSSGRIQKMWKVEFLGDIMMKFVFENMHIIEKFTDKTLI